MAKIVAAPLTRTLAAIAQEIQDDYRSKGKPVYFAAKPYVEAMGRMATFDSRYFDDTAEDIVIRLLGNLSTWRGETATRVKNELKAAVNHHNISRGRKAIY
jgi:hypothetical protein